MKFIDTITAIGFLIAGTILPVNTYAQQNTEKLLYLDASQETINHYSAALNSMFTGEANKEESVSEAKESTSTIFAEKITGFDLALPEFSGGYGTPEDFFGVYFEKYAGYAEAKITMLATEVMNILTGDSEVYWLAVVNRKLETRISRNDEITEQIKTLYFWFEKKGSKNVICSISSDKCSNWPFLPYPLAIEATSDCATDQILVTWNYPYTVCGDNPVFKIYKSMDGGDFELISETNAKEFMFYPNRGEMIALKMKVTAMGMNSEFSSPVDIKAKNSPTNLKASEIILQSHIKVSWDASRDTEYNIYRRETGRRTGQKIKIAKTSRSPFLDADYKQGKSYEYLVAPVCGDGVEATAASVEISTAPFVEITTSSPDIRKPYILVKWDKLNIDRSYRYCLYRAEQRRNRFRKIADDKMLSDTTYFDNTVSLGNDIYYKITLTADTTSVERDFSHVKSIKFSYRGIYFGFQFRPLRARVKNEFLDINPYGQKGNNSYASFAFTADYFFHDRIGMGSGLGISTFSRDIASDTGYSYTLTYLDLPVMLKSPVIKPFNYKNKVVINPILAAGINFSFLVSKKEDSNLEFRDLSPVNISFVGAFGINYYISRTLIMSFSRFYSHGLMDIGTIYDAKTDMEYPNSNTVARGFIIAVNYKFR